MTSRQLFWTTALCAMVLAPAVVTAQGTAADYERANGLRVKYEGLAVNVPGRATWIEKTNHFWYRKSVKGGNEFVWFDAEAQQKRPAFDHARLAASLASATKAAADKYTAITLPFNTIAFVDNESAIEVTVDGESWRCGLTDYVCKKAEAGGYAASSNVDNAYRLRGHVLLVVGEMDNNVDPSSTMQVINQLIKHNKATQSDQDEDMP
jgi:hypothetical protein